MGSFFSGKKKSTQTSNSTSTPTFPDWLESILKDNAQAAEGLASQEYTPYTGQRIAGYTDDELNAFDQIRGLAGSSADAYSQAGDITNQVAQRGLNGYTNEQIQQYMNPYQQQVMDISKRRQLAQFDTAKQNLAYQQGSIGSFGGSRSALAEQELYKNFGQQLADSETQQLYTGYNQALGQAQQGTALAGQAASQMGSLAGAGLQSGLQGAGALQSAGQNQRALSQAGIDVNYQDFLTAQQYPYQQSEYLAGIINPTAQLMQGNKSDSTTVNTSKSTPSLASSLMGMAAMAAGGPMAGMLGGAMGSTMGGLGASSALSTSFGQMLPTAMQGSFMQGAGFQGPIKANGGWAEGGLVTADKPKFDDIASALQALEGMYDRPTKAGGKAMPPSLANLIPQGAMRFEQNDSLSGLSPELADYLAQQDPSLDERTSPNGPTKRQLLEAWKKDQYGQEPDDFKQENLTEGFIDDGIVKKYACGGKVHKYDDGGLASRFGSSLADVLSFREPFRNYLGQQNQNAVEGIKYGYDWLKENPEVASAAMLLAPEIAGVAGLGLKGAQMGSKALPVALKGIKSLATKSPKLAKALRYTGAASLGLGDFSGKEKEVKPKTEIDTTVDDIIAQITPKKEVKETASEPTKTPSAPQEEKDNFNAPLFMFGATLLSSGGKNFFEALGDAGKAYATVKITKEEAIRKAAQEALDKKLEERRVAAYERQVAIGESAAPLKAEIQRARLDALLRKASVDPKIADIKARVASAGGTLDDVEAAVQAYEGASGLTSTFGQMPQGTPRTQPPALPQFMQMR